MSFQAYLDNIKAKTGKGPEDFRRLAEKKGLLEPGVKAGQIVAWLNQDFGLQRGHAMAIVLTFKAATHQLPSKDEAIARLFKGEKARWEKPYNRLLAEVRKFGPDVSIGPTSSYLSLLSRGKKFAIVQVMEDRLDVGLKLKGMVPTDRFEPAGAWNTMVTHRVRVTSPKQIDRELFAHLKQAFHRA